MEVVYLAWTLLHYPIHCSPASISGSYSLRCTVPRMILSVPKQKITPLLKTFQQFPNLTLSKIQLSWQQPTVLLTIPLKTHQSSSTCPTKFPWLSLPFHTGVFDGPQILKRLSFPPLKCSSPWPPWLTSSFSLDCYSDTFPVRFSLATLLLIAPIPLFLLYFFPPKYLLPFDSIFSCLWFAF